MRDKDQSHVWHPFTPMTVYAREQPPIIESGSGFYLTDTEGVRYLDGISSLWCNVHGHQVAQLDQAIEQQLRQIAHTTLLGTSNPLAIEFAERLVECTPDGLNHLFYSDSGSTAVEAAVKMVTQYHYLRAPGGTRRTLFARLGESYHGDTLGSVAVGRIDGFHRCFDDLLFETVTLPTPVAYRVPDGHDSDSYIRHCFAEVERIIGGHATRLAGVIVEPLVQGAAGILVHPSGYLRHVRDVCSRHQVPLIADEVAVGFGKTGTLFACEQEAVTPDVLCLAKGITGGYLPLAATLATSEIYDAFLGEAHERRTFFHGHTYTGNSLACAVGIASLDLFETNDVLANVNRAERYLAERLAQIADHPHVGQIRQKGIMVGIELVADRDRKIAYDPQLRMGNQVILAARKRGVIVRPLGDVVVLMPAVAMSEPQLAELCDAVIASIEEVCQ